MLREKASNNYELYITDNPNDEYLDEFLWNVSVDNLQHSQLKNHVDDPYIYEDLKKVKFKYAILWLHDDNPVYGFFLTVYPELPSNVARFYVRQYKIDRKNNPLKFSFVTEEHKMYAKHLTPYLRSAGIDTMFFTRHSDAVDENKKFELGAKYAKRWYGYTIHSKNNMVVKGIRQNVHYFNAWQPDRQVDDSFLDRLEKI